MQGSSLQLSPLNAHLISSATYAVLRMCIVMLVCTQVLAMPMSYGLCMQCGRMCGEGGAQARTGACCGATLTSPTCAPRWRLRSGARAWARRQRLTG